MKYLEAVGFKAIGDYRAFDEQYSQYVGRNQQTRLLLSESGIEQCGSTNKLSEFLGYMATAFTVAPNAVVAAQQLSRDRKLPVIKWTPTLTRSWVLTCPSLDNMVVKISGDTEENRTQFGFLNHLDNCTKRADTKVSVPSQYALLETAQGFSAVCMEYVEGELLSTLEPADRQRLYDATLHTVDGLLDQKYHALINDIGCRGQNGHYNNMIISPEGAAILFDMPNMSSLDEQSAVRAVLLL